MQDTHNYKINDRIYSRMCHRHFQVILQAGHKVTEMGSPAKDEYCAYCKDSMVADMLDVPISEIIDVMSTFEAVNNARIRCGWVPIGHPTDLWDDDKIIEISAHV